MTSASRTRYIHSRKELETGPPPCLPKRGLTWPRICSRVFVAAWDVVIQVGSRQEFLFRRAGRAGVIEWLKEYGMLSCPSCRFLNNEQARLCGYCGLYLRPIGDYILQEQIGVGGFAEVYRAVNRYTGHLAAIKFLHRKLLDDKEIKQRFLREVEILRDLHSPNIVQIYDFGIIEDIGMYLVMEWIDGETLDVYVHRQFRQRLPQSEALQVFSQLLYGLSRIHERRVVHRDLKPKNFMVVQEQGKTILKILDFGIAWVSGSQALTERGMFVGSTYFMAPEQFRAQKELFGPSTDLYVAALLLAWMLTGKHVFTGSSIKDLAVQHCYNMPPMLSELCAEESYLPALEGVVAYALQKEPHRRFQSAMEFLQAINHPLEFQRQFLQTNQFRPHSAQGSGGISLASASDPLTLSSLGHGSVTSNKEASRSAPMEARYSSFSHREQVLSSADGSIEHAVHIGNIVDKRTPSQRGTGSLVALGFHLQAEKPSFHDMVGPNLELDEPVTTAQYAASSLKTDVMEKAQSDLLVAVRSEMNAQSQTSRRGAVYQDRGSSSATPSAALPAPSSPPPSDAPHNVGPSSPPVEANAEQFRALSEIIASWPTSILDQSELARASADPRTSSAKHPTSRSLSRPHGWYRTSARSRAWYVVICVLVGTVVGTGWWFFHQRHIATPAATSSSSILILPTVPALSLRPLHPKHPQHVPMLKPSQYPRWEPTHSPTIQNQSAIPPRPRNQPIPERWRYPAVTP